MAYPPDPPPSGQPPQYHPPGPGAEPDPWKPQPTPAQERQRLAQEAAIHTKAEKLTLLDKFVRGVIY